MISFRAINKSHDKIIFSLFIASCLHIVALFGLNIVKPKNTSSQIALDVTLVTQQSVDHIKQADFLAIQNQPGSGTETEQKLLTQRSDLPEIPYQQDTNQLPELSQHKEQESKSKEKLLASDKGANVADSDAKTDLKEKKEDSKINIPSPTERNQLIAKLEARLADKEQEYAKLPRIKRYTSIEAKQSVDAQYIYDWVKKIETLGTINYPAEARRYKMYGKLRLMVAINANGTINGVQVLQSSGIKILDEAAIRIVYLAAPYMPFPEELRKEADIIEIIRTWHFTRDDFISTI